MYFYNVKKLKEDLKVGPLPVSELWKYLWFIVFFMMLSSILDLTRKTLATQNDIMAESISAVIYCLGLILVYRSNGSSQGVDTIGRFISLFWVMQIRVFSFVAPLIFIAGMSSEKLAADSFELKLGDVFFFALIECYIFYRVIGHIRDLRR